MAAPESKHEQIMQAVDDRLQTMRAAAGFAYTPDRVGRPNEWNDAWFRESDFATVYFMFPGIERTSEQPSRQLEFVSEFSIVGCHRFRQSVPNPFRGYEEIVAPVALANGPLTIAAQPIEASQITIEVLDEDLSVSAAEISIVGTDPVGAPLTVAYSLATDGRWRRPRGAFASIASATVSGVAGATAADKVSLSAGVSRWQVQNRMVRDVLTRISTSPQLAELVSGVVNVYAIDVDRDLKMEGWAVVKIEIGVQYNVQRTAI